MAPSTTMTRPHLIRFSGVLAVILLALLPAAIAAHGGSRVLRTTEGPYRIDAVVSRAGSQVDETIVLLDDQTGRPLANAVIALTLEDESGQRVGPFVVRSTDGNYEVRYPPPEDGERWTVLIDIQGPQGTVAVHHPYRAPDDDGWGGRRALFLNLLLIAAIVAIVIFLPRWRRNRQDKN
ncbi:MAG: hypothetical protein ACRDJE_16620 [Dehalococcoidia bacterium]